jgi:hypothetical protein
VSENSTGSAYTGVGGIATESGSPSIIESPGSYYASLSFTVDAYDSGGAPIYYNSATFIGVYVDSSASISSSLGYTGMAYGYAEVGFGGSCVVDVELPE